MRIRTAAAIALAAGLALTTSGCGFLVNQATEQHFDPSDGVSAYVDDVTVANMIIFTDGNGPANLVFGAVNNSDRTQKINFQLEVGNAKHDYSASVATGYTSHGFGDAQDAVEISQRLDPGSLQRVYVQAGDAPGVQLDIPVLNADDWEFYAGLNP